MQADSRWHKSRLDNCRSYILSSIPKLLLKHFDQKTRAVSFRLELMQQRIRLRDDDKRLNQISILEIWRNPSRSEDYLDLKLFTPTDVPVTLIDVGSNAGLWASGFFANNENITIAYCFEPNHELAQVIKSNLRNKPVKIFSVALGAIRGEMVLTVPSGKTELATLWKYEIKNTADTEDFHETFRVKVAPLDDYHNHWEKDEFVVLKIDAQGSEVDILSGAVQTLKSVSVLIIECTFVSVYRGLDASFSQICRILGKSGLYPIIFQSWGRDLSSYPIERDVIFVRKELLEKVLFSPEKFR